MKIRQARSDEWQAVRELRLRALAGDPDAFGEPLEEALARSDADWRAWLESEARAIFIAVADDGVWVAMAVGAPAPDRPEIAGLFGMWVAPEARRQGIGSVLIDAVEGWASGAGYATIGLGVTTTNGSAIRLYESKGFVDTGEHYPLREGTDLAIQIMGKVL